MKVALVVGTYNGARVIGKCVKSLLGTDYPDKEIVVVDDGSTDQTHEVLKEFENSIRVLKKERGGVSSARNHAAERTDAELIATTDNDCEVDPGWISNAVRHFSSPGVGAVTGEKRYRVTNTVSAVRSAEYAIRFKRRGTEANSIECPCAIIRKDAWEEIGGFNTGTKVGGEDTEFGYRLKRNGYRIVYDKDVIVHHDAEDSLKMYVKRNYRNGVAYVRNFLWNKRESIGDDFFPITLKLQPVFNLGFLSLLAGGLLVSNIILFVLSLAVFAAMTLMFYPVSMEVARMRGAGSVPFSLMILHLRNQVWSAALFAGLWKYWRPWR
jgi:cellulose synthase/poly-beta-1,6-N-acetylglucosamine synthase-like glycosyltransferase